MKTKIEFEVDQETLVNLGKQKLQELLLNLGSPSDVAEISKPKIVQPILNYRVNQNSETYIIIRPKREINATGVALPGGRIKVLKGSQFTKTAAPNFYGSYADLRNELRKRGILDENFVLTQDYEFSSMSAGASVILGTQCNTGPWRRK